MVVYKKKKKKDSFVKREDLFSYVIVSIFINPSCKIVGFTKITYHIYRVKNKKKHCNIYLFLF